MTQEEKRAWAQEQLRSRQAELGRVPHKDDFDEVTRARIKAFLGPWPRALESAGLKAVRPAQKNQKSKGPASDGAQRKSAHKEKRSETP